MRWFRSMVCGLALTMVACEPDPTGTDSETTSEEIGPDGGTITSGAVTLDVPAGALSEDLAITMGIEDPGVPLPVEYLAAGDVYAFTPHGQTFDEPVTITLPSLGITSDDGAVLKLDGPSDTTWEEVGGVAWDGADVTFDTSSFSFYRAVRFSAPAQCSPTLSASRLADLDMTGARRIFESCVNNDPTDVEARFGRALTNLATMDSWQSAQNALRWCDQNLDVEGAVFGTGGLFDTMYTSGDGQTDLTVQALLDGGSTSIDGLQNADYVVVSVRNGEEGPRMDIEIRADRRSSTSVQLWSLELDDPYGDGSTSVTDGTVIDVSRLLERPYLGVTCDDVPALCGGSLVADGTITFVDAGRSADEAVEIAFDLEWSFRGWGDSDGSLAEVVVTLDGTINDTVDRSVIDHGIPFTDQPYLCDTEDCATVIFLSTIADWCDVPSMDALSAQIRDMAGEMRQVADDFRAAGQEPTLTFDLPADKFDWLVRDTVHFNQTDALALAAAVDGVVAGLELAAQYKMVDPTMKPEDFVADDIVDFDFEWDTDGGPETCTPHERHGDDLELLHAQLDEHAMEHRADADFTEAEAAMRRLFETLLAALGSSPEGLGFVEPMGARNADLRGALEGDLQAALDSMDITDAVGLPSSSQVDIALGQFFASPVDKRQMLIDTSLNTFFLYEPLDVAQCDRLYVGVDDDVGEWAAGGAGIGRLDRDVIDDGWDPGQIPAVIDGDLYDGTRDDYDYTWLDNDATDNFR